MTNRFRPHVLVLPEDDADRQLANGFLLHLDLAPRAIQVLAEAGGWHEVVERFLRDHVRDMERYTNCFMILLIDFDDSEERLEAVKAKIPQNLANRVFFLGSLSDPEALKREFADTYENIGLRLAQDCREGTSNTWGHRLLQNNAGELGRLRASVYSILFPGT